MIAKAPDPDGNDTPSPAEGGCYLFGLNGAHVDVCIKADSTTVSLYDSKGALRISITQTAHTSVDVYDSTGRSCATMMVQ